MVRRPIARPLQLGHNDLNDQFFVPDEMGQKVDLNESKHYKNLNLIPLPPPLNRIRSQYLDRALQCLQYFQHIIGEHEVSAYKPDPQGLIHSLRLLQLLLLVV